VALPPSSSLPAGPLRQHDAVPGPLLEQPPGAVIDQAEPARPEEHASEPPRHGHGDPIGLHQAEYLCKSPTSRALTIIVAVVVDDAGDGVSESEREDVVRRPRNLRRRDIRKYRITTKIEINIIKLRN
jgi:hypothetical protein